MKNGKRRPRPPAERRFVSVREAAGVLGISIRRVLQLIEEGKLGAAQINNKFLIPITGLEELREIRRTQRIERMSR